MSAAAILREALDLLEERGELAAAALKFREALAAGAQGVEAGSAHAGLARCLLTTGDLSAGESELRLALEADPTNGEAHTFLGLLALKRRDRKSALQELRLGAKLAPESSVARHNLARLLASTGRRGEALPHYEAAVRLAPRSHQAHFELGELLLRDDQLARGAQEMARSLELNPAFAPPALVLAEMALAAGEAKKAASLLLEVLRLDSAEPLLLEGLVRVYRRTNETDEALRRCAEWLELDPDSADAHHELAELHLARGDRDAAETAARRFSDLAPHDLRAPALLGRLSRPS
jgi:tetratricopeptide (TPR) repeat protein